MELQVGQKATRSITLTTKHVAAYAEMSGDYNPLHFDEAFAAQTTFGGLIVQGLPFSTRWSPCRCPVRALCS